MTHQPPRDPWWTFAATDIALVVVLTAGLGALIALAKLLQALALR